MADAIRHRGPDSAGRHAEPGIGLGFRRLGIVDVERGDQPIASEDGAVVAVCNGEIYNAEELRASLRAHGHAFRSLSDAEVIVHLYEELGTDVAARLRGMFAFAIWDRGQRRLMLARDRLGIKPLHWTVVNGDLFFGSEVKSILASGRLGVAMDPDALRELFTIGFVAAPRTLFRRVRRLEPAHFLLYREGAWSVHRYWQVDFPAAGSAPRLPARVWEEKLLERLEEAVRLHLRSDVAVGAWLSPGLDSSTVTALARRLTGRPLPAFTLAFDGSDCDERAGRCTLADFPEQGVEGTEVTCRAGDLELFPRAVWHVEDPTTGGLEVPRMVLSEAASRAVKVVVTGEGADEVLGGYPWYAGERLLQPLSRLPTPWRRWIAARPSVASRWPGASRVLAGPSTLDRERYLRLIGAPDGAPHLRSLLVPDLLQSLSRVPPPEGPDGQLPRRAAGWRHFNRLQYHDLTLRLPDLILHRVDRTSMAHSLEVRVPFLDHHLVEFCATIPPWLKLHWRREKYVLRRALQGLLPREIVWRKKRGLTAPVQRWFRGRLPEFAEELLSAPRLRAAGYFEPAAVAALRRRVGEGHRETARLLLGVLAVQVWHEVFCRGWRPPLRTG